jgi:hypothetical protein
VNGARGFERSPTIDNLNCAGAHVAIKSSGLIDPLKAFVK